MGRGHIGDRVTVDDYQTNPDNQFKRLEHKWDTIKCSEKPLNNGFPLLMCVARANAPLFYQNLRFQ
jgi:hypothetical protein